MVCQNCGGSGSVLGKIKDKPVKERFGLCPWGLYSIDVKAS